MSLGSENRRVLYVLQGLPVPFDRRAWLHATTLAANGYAVSFICPKGRGYNLSREEREGVDIYRYWRPVEGEGKLAFIAELLWCFFATFFLSLRIALFGRGFDILHICNPPEIYWPIAWFWRAFGKVFIWDHRDLSPELAAAKLGADDGLIMSLLLLLERLSFQAAQIVVATNESYKKIAIERGGKRPRTSLSSARRRRCRNSRFTSPTRRSKKASRTSCSISARWGRRTASTI